MSGAPPRYIRVVCDRNCPNCQFSNTSPNGIRSILNSLTAVAIIAVLAAYVLHCWQTNVEKYAFPDVNVVSEVREEPVQKLNQAGSQAEGAENIDMIMNKVNSLQADVSAILKKLSALGKRDEEDYKRRIEALKNEIKLQELDKTGRSDFALESSGGCILTTRKTKTYTAKAATISYLGIPLIKYHSDPRSIIQKSVSPGECWAIEDDEGTAVIQLISSIFITHVSIEHIPKQLSPNGRIDSAPRSFSLYGLTSVESQDPHSFGLFEYDSEGPPIQTFEVSEASEVPFSIVEFTVHSNHGNPNFTCIYRIRIHGKMES